MVADTRALVEAAPATRRNRTCALVGFKALLPPPKLFQSQLASSRTQATPGGIGPRLSRATPAPAADRSAESSPACTLRSGCAVSPTLPPRPFPPLRAAPSPHPPS